MIHRTVGHGPACLLFLALSAPATASPLTLGEAIERASSANPSLAAQAPDAEAANARAAREAMAPPLMLGTEIENVAGTGQLSGLDSTEVTVSLSRLVELGGKRAGRRALGDAEVARAGHELSTARLDLRALTVQRFIEVVADQERLALAEEREALIARTRGEVERVVNSARNPETDLRAAEILLAEAELEREHAEHELRAARVTLAASWGQRIPDFDSASMTLHTLPDVEPLEALAARLPASAVIRGAALEVEAATARERLASSEARPDVNLSLGVRRVQVYDDQALVLGFSLPLGSGSRGRLALSERRASSTAAARRREALETESYQQLFERYQELGHARTEYEALDRTMIPKAEQALTVARRGFDAGRFPFQVLSQTQDILFDLRRRRIDSALRYHSLHAELQRLVAAVEAP